MNLSKTLVRDLPDRGCIEITAELRDGSTGLSPGFSLTAMIWEPSGRLAGRARRRLGRDVDAAGCLHDEIVAAAPELATLVPLHLADPAGLPMHAVANGWYLYSGKAAEYERERIARGDTWYAEMGKTTDHDRAARALAIDPAELPVGLDEQSFAAFVASLAPTYRDRAEAAIELLRSLPDE